MSKFTKGKEERLLELLNEELKLFERMREQTTKQKDLLERDDMTAFDKSLDIRQELIEKINGLHQESDILMQSYMSYCKTQSGKKNEAIDKLWEGLRSGISECHEQNVKNMAAIKEKKEEFKKRISELDTSKKTLDAYALTVPGNSELFDKKT